MLLDSIVARVQQRVEERQRQRSLAHLERALGAASPPRGFGAALHAAPGGMALVGELKKASPASGRLRQDFDVASLAQALARGGASALSVLTEVDHFQGNLENLQRSEEAGLPRLQKDFVRTEYQVFEGRVAGADAVLLIAEALPGKRLLELCRLALELGMDVLCEGHDPEHVQRAASLAERDVRRIFVGVNNRDLRTFHVTLEHSFAALSALPRELAVISESGIETGTDVRRLRDAGARGILVGTRLMRATDVEGAARDLLREVRAP